MEAFTPEQMLGVILAAAGAITTVGTAIEKLVKALRAAKAPNDRQDARISALEEWREDVDSKLQNDKAQLDSIESGLRASYQAQLALLDHGIDGNNIEQMQHAKADLQKHLINR